MSEKWKYIAPVTVVVAFLMIADIFPMALEYYRFSKLREQARNGNGEAAWEIFQGSIWTGPPQYKPFLSNPSDYLEMAVRLKHPEAETWMAEEIRDGHIDFLKYGDSPQSAVFNLLTDASPNCGRAAFDLGKAYLDGYFVDEQKLEKALHAFELANSLKYNNSWKYLAQILSDKESKVTDHERAYYFICLEAAWTHPHSYGGEEIWKTRVEMEKNLALEQMKNVWSQVDKFVKAEGSRQNNSLSEARLLGMAISEDSWRNAAQHTDENEAHHRQDVISRK